MAVGSLMTGREHAKGFQGAGNVLLILMLVTQMFSL